MGSATVDLALAVDDLNHAAMANELAYASAIGNQFTSTTMASADFYYGMALFNVVLSAISMGEITKSVNQYKKFNSLSEEGKKVLTNSKVLERSRLLEGLSEADLNKLGKLTENQVEKISKLSNEQIVCILNNPHANDIIRQIDELPENIKLDNKLADAFIKQANKKHRINTLSDLGFGTKAINGNIDKVDEMYEICERYTDKELLKDKISNKIQKQHKGFETIMDELRMEIPFKGILEVSMENLEKYIPASYYSKVKSYLTNNPGTRDEVLRKIQQLYDNYDGDIKKTVQNHHWIEQCVLKKTADYPFLKHPPMDYDLFTSEKNLSLIVGHNGPHSPEYTGFIYELLNDLKDEFRNEFNINYNISMANNKKVKDFFNSSIEEVIEKIYQFTKDHENMINSSGKIFILK